MEKETDTIKKQIITEEENVKIMQRCPRFQFCNAPICPLDYFQDERTKLEGDEKCVLAKSIRKRIGKGTALKYQGMTRKEYAGMKIWNDKSDEEKRGIVERGRRQLSKFRQKLV